MRTPRAFPQEGAEHVLKLLKKAKTKLEFQRIQCIWMRLKKNLPAPDIADLIGWHVSSVRRVHAQYYKDGDKILKVLVVEAAIEKISAKKKRKNC